MALTADPDGVKAASFLPPLPSADDIRTFLLLPLEATRVEGKDSAVNSAQSFLSEPPSPLVYVFVMRHFTFPQRRLLVDPATRLWPFGAAEDFFQPPKELHFLRVFEAL